MNDKYIVKTKSRRQNKIDKRKLALSPVYFNVGVYLIVPFLLGIFLGYQLDKWFHSKPIFVLVGIVFGTISAFYNLWKLLNEE